MTKRSTLKDYHAKRDFRRTREPEGEENASRQKPLFVIQKHDASRLHYDYRIEVEGSSNPGPSPRARQPIPGKSDWRSPPKIIPWPTPILKGRFPGMSMAEEP